MKTAAIERILGPPGVVKVRTCKESCPDSRRRPIGSPGDLASAVRNVIQRKCFVIRSGCLRVVVQKCPSKRNEIIGILVTVSSRRTESCDCGSSVRGEIRQKRVACSPEIVLQLRDSLDSITCEILSRARLVYISLVDTTRIEPCQIAAGVAY